MPKFFLLLGVLVLSACARPSQDIYDARDVGRPLTVEYGKVVDARPITIQEKETGAGALAGGILGGVGGSAIGSGSGQIAGAVAGAVVGAVAGNAAEYAAQRKMGIQYVIVTERGETMSIAQFFRPDEKPAAIGQRVILERGENYLRVIPTDVFPDSSQ